MITTKITASKIGGFGFYVEGEAPCRINVLPNSAASFAGLTVSFVLIFKFYFCIYWFFAFNVY